MDNTLVTTREKASLNIVYLLPFIAALGLIVLLYKDTFAWWWWEWTYPGSFYAHALFVPFFVAAMIWRDKDKLAAAPYDPSWLGVAYLIPAMLLLLLGQKADVTTVTSISFMLLILGTSTMIVGKTRTRLLMFPLLFIMLMMPLVPDQLINSIAFPIQLTSAKIATFLLNALTLHSVREGTLIRMDSYRLAVELPCSGFKTLVSLLTFTAAFAYLTDAVRWKRWTLFLTTIPLSLVINALRITFIGIVGELISSRAAATFHDYSGFIVLILAFTFLFNFAKVLRCERFLGMALDDSAEEKGGAEASASVTDERLDETRPEPSEPWWKPVLGWRPTRRQLQQVLPFVIAVNLVLLFTMGVQAVAIRHVVPQAPIARAQVPMEFQAPGIADGAFVTYKAVDDPNNDKLTKEVQENLSPTRVISRVYQGSDGSAMELFITAGNGRKTFHDPHTCMLGSDAVLVDHGQIDVPSASGPVRVMETRFRKGGLPDETEMLICYVVDGKMVPQTEDVRNRIIWQTLFGDGGKPSYCFRVTQRSPGTDATRRAQITHFVSGLWSHIGPVLEGKVPGDKDAPPEPIDEPNAGKN